MEKKKKKAIIFYFQLCSNEKLKPDKFGKCSALGQKGYHDLVCYL